MCCCRQRERRARARAEAARPAAAQITLHEVLNTDALLFFLNKILFYFKQVTSNLQNCFNLGFEKLCLL